MELCTKLSDRVLKLETTKIAHAKKITNLKKRVKRLERNRKSRSYRLKRSYKVGLSARVESSDEESLGRINDEEMFDTDVLNDKEIVVEDVNAASIATVVTAAPTTAVSIDDITLAQALVEIKTSNPKAREPLMMKKKAQISLDKKLSFKLQAKEDKQERIAEEKAQLIEDENLAWDNVQAILDANYELVARLQEEEQGELTIEEKSRLFVELMDKRMKHFAKLRAEEKRRKPLTNAQKRN
nr:hypothetical protein [Tanacetum cinerariifolium]